MKKNFEEYLQEEKEYDELTLTDMKKKSYFYDRPKFNHFHKKPRSVEMMLNERLGYPEISNK